MIQLCCCCSVAKLCSTLCNPMHCSMPGFLVLHHLPELAQTHVHWVCDAIQPSRPLSSPSLPAFSLDNYILISLVSFVILHVLCYAVLCLVASVCLILCYPTDCSPPGPLSMGLSRQEYLSWLSCPPPGDLPNPGIKPMSHVFWSGRWVLYH